MQELRNDKMYMCMSSNFIIVVYDKLNAPLLLNDGLSVYTNGGKT